MAAIGIGDIVWRDGVIYFRGHPMPRIERIRHDQFEQYRMGMADGRIKVQNFAVPPPGIEPAHLITRDSLVGLYVQHYNFDADGDQAQRFREFLDYLHDTYGVIDTTVLEQGNPNDPNDYIAFARQRTLWGGQRTLWEGQHAADAARYALPPMFFPPLDLPRVDWDLATPIRNTPERKAMALLYRKLTRKQRRSLRNAHKFEHKGKQGVYRFMLNDMSGVRLIRYAKLGGRTIETTYTLCIQSTDPSMPKGDVILARYLECKADEEKFLATANFRKAEIKDEAMGTTYFRIPRRGITSFTV